ncbi:MAG: hypothetical protein WCG34_06680 [Leptolinea sp.]
MAFRIIAFLALILLTACSTELDRITASTESEPMQATLTPILLPTGTATPLPTLDPATLPVTCLDEAAAGQIVEGWLNREGYATLKTAWQAFLDIYGDDNLVSSTTDYNNEFAHAITWQKMLLVGEYPFRLELDGTTGFGYCSVLVYAGGIGPEVGLGVTDVYIGGEWSGYASGLVDSQEATRAYLAEQIGKPVTVRYMAAQNPQDAGFERPGFFSPVMQRLWNNSYYTKIPTDLNFLFDRVGQPRGPSIRELMGLASELKGFGVFLEYIVDTIR